MIVRGYAVLSAVYSHPHFVAGAEVRADGRQSQSDIMEVQSVDAVRC